MGLNFFKNSIRLLIISNLLTVPLFCQAQQNPFLALQYDSIVAYEFQGEGARMIKYCLEKESSRIYNSKRVSKKSISALEAVITSNDSYGQMTASCFDPHFAIVYYLQDSIIASVDICLDCNYLSSSLKIPATNNTIIKVDDDYSYTANGFSKSARHEIREYCRMLGFTRFLKPATSMFDEN